MFHRLGSLTTDWHRPMYAETRTQSREDQDVDAKEGKVKASIETMAYYNMILTEAIFQLLEEKGLLNREQVKERMEKIKAETKLSFQMIQ
jgi:hypothetical protein